ncbi:MAG TPA: ABC transporter permease [Candidatus Limiplasma sp.]|nr:ABC transporter permease [Candidatus Limiplasma sp.]HPS80487.1 ABC transporter permease [Candidatus Limiplasma sp.]
MLKKLLHSREVTALAFVVFMFLGVGAINPAFLTPANIWLCLNSSVVYTVVAVGIALVIITGEIDVSVGATLGMTAAVSGTMIRNGEPWILAIGAALLIGLLIGSINGFGVTVLKIPSIIMTLGINGIVRGLIYVFTNGKWVENIPFDFKNLSQGRLFSSITFFYLGAILLIVAVHLILTRTKRGRYLAAVGDNIGGATLLGIPVDTTKFSAFALCGVLAAVGGVLFVSRVGFVTPIAGNGYEMKVIAACVLGGISLSGGVGTVIGAGLGAAIMASISRILVFVGFSSDYDDTITGILLIIIVVSDALLRRRAVEQARRQRLAAKTQLLAADGKEATAGE